MPYYRVSFEGYLEGEYDDEETAKDEMEKSLDADYLDGYGRGRRDLIGIETFNEETQEWE